MSPWWAWDLYPLKPGAWPNEHINNEDVQPGHSFINKHTRTGRRRVAYLDSVRAWAEGQTEPTSIVSSRNFYRPTIEDVEFIKSVIPGGEAENPSWHTIEAELVSGGLQSSALADEKAPTLIRLLAKLKTHGGREGRGDSKRSRAATKRPKLSKAIETEVLTKSGRRCCVCFGLDRDSKVKRGQIAHVDHDRVNNAPSNLAWLCLEHHDAYDSRTSQSKGLTSDELKEYRTKLYRAIEQGV